MAPWFPCAALGIAAVLVAPEEGADPDLAGLIRGGRVGEVVARLEKGEARAALVADPGSLERLCSGAADCFEAIADAGKDGDRLVAILETMAAACSTSQPTSSAALCARAHAGFAWAQRLASPGKAGSAECWRSVARDYEDVSSREASLAGYSWHAAYALTRADECDGSDKVPSFERADELLGRYRKGRERDPVATAFVVTLWLERARIAAARKRSAAEEIVSNALEALGSAEKENPEHPRLLTARNEVARAVRLLKLPRPKVEFAVATVLVGEGLELEVPRGLRWTEPEGRDRSIWQSTMGYRQVRRLSFDETHWNNRLVIGDRTDIDGTNIKGIAEARFEQVRASLKEVRSKVAPRRATLKNCNPGYYFEVEGKEAQGAYARHRVWLFKSTQGQLKTFELLVSCRREGEPDDPEFQHVLDSIRERVKK